MSRDQKIFNPLSDKVTLVFGFTTVVTAVLVLALSYLGSIRSFYRSAEDRVTTLADSIVYNVSVLSSQQDIFSLSRLVEKSATLQDVVFIAVTDVHGKIIAHSDQAQIGQLISSPLISQAVESQTQQKSITNTRISFVLPLHGPSFSPEYHDISGALWVEMDFQASLQRVRLEYAIIALGGFVCLFAIYPIFLLLTRLLIIKRLLKINSGLEQVEAGDLTTRIEVEQILNSDDEINLLANQFNQMTASLFQGRLDIQHERDFALQVMNSMGQGLTILGEDGKLEYVNPAFANLLLANLDELVGNKLGDYSDQGDFEEKIQNVLQMGSATFETRLIRADHEWANVLITAVGHKVDDNRTSIIAVVTDLTERARLEQMKSDFINRASHELRTPLTTAILMIDLLDQDIQGEEQREFWDTLKESISRQQGLVESLLTQGRIESGRYKVCAAPTDLAPIAADVFDSVQPNARANNLELVFSSESDLPPVCGDAQALSEVITNLLSNAIKFSKPGGKVQIRVIHQLGSVHLIVQDEGIGIPPEDLPNLFMRFSRASNATENEIQGSGLGLFFIKSIVSDLGGEIQVESTLGVGTRFTVILPVWQDPDPEVISTPLS